VAAAGVGAPAERPLPDSVRVPVAVSAHQVLETRLHAALPERQIAGCEENAPGHREEMLKISNRIAGSSPPTSP
jgi:hypothetical protein